MYIDIQYIDIKIQTFFELDTWNFPIMLYHQLLAYLLQH